MAVSVDVVGKLVNINAVFRDSSENVVDPPVDAIYMWSVTAGKEYVIVEGTGRGNTVGKVTPVAVGSATISLTVSGGGLAAPLTGTLEVTVLDMKPASVELNGTVVNAA